MERATASTINQRGEKKKLGIAKVSGLFAFRLPLYFFPLTFASPVICACCVYEAALRVSVFFRSEARELAMGKGRWLCGLYSVVALPTVPPLSSSPFPRVPA